MDPLVKKFSRLYQLSDEEKQLLKRLNTELSNLESRSVIVNAGDPINHAFLLQRGWAMVYKNLPDGEQQVVSFAIPGDFLGLFSIMLRKAEYTIETVTDVQLCKIRWEHLTEMFSNYPRLAMAVCWFGARDQVMLREHMVRIGKQPALNRVSHIFLELCHRLDKIGMVNGGSYEFPLNQEMLANTLGLTPIHISRTLKKLKESGLIIMEKNQVTLTNPEELAKKTDYDKSYLETSVFPDVITEQTDVTN